jgi:uncharacterized membrane protein YkvA (DUF1232 family)
VSAIDRWKHAAKQLRAEVYALYLAYRDPRTPWYARVLAASLVGYALSPIDLVPDFIPVLGLLDDLVVLPAGILLARKLIPEPILAECRRRSRGALDRGEPVGRVAAAVIVGVWLLLAGWGVFLAMRLVS